MKLLPRPKVQHEGRVIVIARPDKGRSKSVTLHETSPEEVIAKVREMAGGDAKSTRRKTA